MYEAVRGGQSRGRQEGGGPGPFIIQETIGTGKTRASRALCKTGRERRAELGQEEEEEGRDSLSLLFPKRGEGPDT